MSNEEEPDIKKFIIRSIHIRERRERRKKETRTSRLITHAIGFIVVIFLIFITR